MSLVYCLNHSCLKRPDCRRGLPIPATQVVRQYKNFDAETRDNGTVKCPGFMLIPKYLKEKK